MNRPQPARSVSAEWQGQRDLTAVGFGFVALGILSFLGVVLALTLSNFRESALSVAVPVGGGAVLVVLAGSMISGFGIRAKHGAIAGCGSVAVSIGLGVLVFLAAMVFLTVSCFATVMTAIR
jgi:hypothetical protein